MENTKTTYANAHTHMEPNTRQAHTYQCPGSEQMPEARMNSLMRINEAASFLAVSRRTLYKLISNNLLTVVRLTATLPRLRRAEVEALATGIATGERSQ
jgi:excisionase family DNA binding protein